MLSFATGSNFHTFDPRQPLIFLHYMLVDQLYAKEVYFCSFVTKSNQTSTKYSPDVLNRFYRIITHGESHRIFRSPPPSNSIYPHFHVFTAFSHFHFFHYNPTSPLQTIQKISTGPNKPPPMLFFRLKQNSLLSPHAGTLPLPLMYMQF